MYYNTCFYAHLYTSIHIYTHLYTSIHIYILYTYTSPTHQAKCCWNVSVLERGYPLLAPRIHRGSSPWALYNGDVVMNPTIETLKSGAGVNSLSIKG